MVGSEAPPGGPFEWAAPLAWWGGAAADVKTMLQDTPLPLRTAQLLPGVDILDLFGASEKSELWKDSKALRCIVPRVVCGWEFYSLLWPLPSGTSQLRLSDDVELLVGRPPLGEALPSLLFALVPAGYVHPQAVTADGEARPASWPTIWPDGAVLERELASENITEAAIFVDGVRISQETVRRTRLPRLVVLCPSVVYRRSTTLPADNWGLFIGPRSKTAVLLKKGYGKIDLHLAVLLTTEVVFRQAAGLVAAVARMFVPFASHGLVPALFGGDFSPLKLHSGLVNAAVPSHESGAADGRQDYRRVLGVALPHFFVSNASSNLRFLTPSEAKATSPFVHRQMRTPASAPLAALPTWTLLGAFGAEHRAALLDFRERVLPVVGADFPLAGKLAAGNPILELLGFGRRPCGSCTEVEVGRNTPLATAAWETPPRWETPPPRPAPGRDDGEDSAKDSGPPPAQGGPRGGPRASLAPILRGLGIADGAPEGGPRAASPALRMPGAPEGGPRAAGPASRMLGFPDSAPPPAQGGPQAASPALEMPAFASDLSIVVRSASSAPPDLRLLYQELSEVSNLSAPEAPPPRGGPPEEAPRGATAALPPDAPTVPTAARSPPAPGLAPGDSPGMPARFGEPAGGRGDIFLSTGSTASMENHTRLEAFLAVWGDDAYKLQSLMLGLPGGMDWRGWTDSQGRTLKQVAALALATNAMATLETAPPPRALATSPKLELRGIYQSGSPGSRGSKRLSWAEDVPEDAPEVRAWSSSSSGARPGKRQEHRSGRGRWAERRAQAPVKASIDNASSSGAAAASGGGDPAPWQAGGSSSAEAAAAGGQAEAAVAGGQAQRAQSAAAGGQPKARSVVSNMAPSGSAASMVLAGVAAGKQKAKTPPGPRRDTQSAV